MTRATATWTNTLIEAFEAGDFLRAPDVLSYILQNEEFLGQLHDHSGDPGDGATLTAGDDGLLFFAMPASE